MLKMWKKYKKIPKTKIKISKKVKKQKLKNNGLNKLIASNRIRTENLSNNKLKLKVLKLNVGNQIKRKNKNKIIRSINGNIRGMKIISWNKTDRSIEEKK